MNNELELKRVSGPEYVSETEWQSSRAKKRGKLLLLLSLIPLAGMLAAFLVVYSAISVRYSAHKKLVDALSGLKNYSVKIYAIDPSGTKSPWREELYYGGDFEIKLFSGHIVFEKFGNRFTYAEPTIHGQGGSMSWQATKPFLSEVAAAVPPFELFPRNPNGLVESKGSGPHTFTFSSKDMTYSVRVTGRDDSPAEISIGGNNLNGTARIMECIVTPLTAAPFDPPGKATQIPAAKGKGGLPLSFGGKGGNHLQVVAADINVRGDAFFLIRSDIEISVKDITREKVDRYYKPEVSDIKIGTQPLILVRYIALDDNAVKWPTTLDASFTPGFRRTDDNLAFKYTFKEPTCYLLPLGLGTPVSDLTCYEFLFDAARAREEYFAESFIKNGIPKMIQGSTPAGFKEIPGDRSKSVREGAAASFYGHQLIIAGEDVSREIADGWGSAAHLLVFLGKGEEAHNAFFAADALRR